MSARKTIKDMAKAAGVSIGTVSNVINGTGRVAPETVRKVRKVIEENGFIPNTAARRLRDKNSHLIALVVPFYGKGIMHDNPFFWHLGTGIETGARNHEFHVIFTGLGQDQNLSFIRERHIEGLIVLGTFEGSPVVEQVKKLKMPCVYMDSYLSDPELYQVFSDDQMGGYLGTKYLLGLGHRRIALLSGNFPDRGVIYERWRGYRLALEENGIEYNPDLIIDQPNSMIGGYRAAQDIFRMKNTVSAVFALSDVSAMGFMRGINELGLSVPADISVVGYDDIFLSEFTVPSLTTIRQHIIQRGQIAVNLLLEQIDKRTAVRERTVNHPVELTIRKTTTPPKTRYVPMSEKWGTQ